MVSILLIYKKYFEDFELKTVPNFKVDGEKRSYSDSLKPMIVTEAIICTIISANFLTILKDIWYFGLFVWNRNNLGAQLQNRILHSCLLMGFFRYK